MSALFDRLSVFLQLLLQTLYLRLHNPLLILLLYIQVLNLLFQILRFLLLLLHSSLQLHKFLLPYCNTSFIFLLPFLFLPFLFLLSYFRLVLLLFLLLDLLCCLGLFTLLTQLFLLFFILLFLSVSARCWRPRRRRRDKPLAGFFLLFLSVEFYVFLDCFFYDSAFITIEILFASKASVEGAASVTAR